MTQHDRQKTPVAALRYRMSELRALCKVENGWECPDHHDRLRAAIERYQTELEGVDDQVRTSLAELRVLQKRYRTLYDHAPVGYLTVDDRYTIHDVNPAGCDLLQYGKDDLVGKTFTDYICGEGKGVLHAEKESLKSFSGPGVLQLTLCAADGTHVEIRISMIALPGHGDGRQLVLLVAETDTGGMGGRLASAHAGREREIRKLLHLAVEPLSSENLYDRFLDAVLSFGGLGADPGGCILMLEGDSLALKAHKNIASDQLRQCFSIDRKSCLCGRAVAENRVLFSHSGEDDEVRLCLQNRPHANYCVPIVTSNNTVRGSIALTLQQNTICNGAVEDLVVTSSQVLASVVERKEEVDRLTEQGKQLSSIYSAAETVGLIVCHLQGEDARIIEFSPGAEKIFGYSSNDMIGQSIAVLYRDEDRHSIPSRLARLRRGEVLRSFDRVMRRKNGEHFPVEVSVSPLADNSGKIARALAVCIDITELKQVQCQLQLVNRSLERRVEERTRELQDAEKQVLHVEKLAAVGQLSASIAHEFNNPLQGIMAVLKGVFRRAVLEEEDEKLVEAAVGECNRMVRLIRDLQDFNRPSSGKQAWINLNQLLDSTLLLYRSDFRKNGINLVKRLAGELPAILVIPDQIRQVVVNLLNNAVDACGHGCTISVETALINSTVELRVSDNGMGIAPAHQGRIFEPFFTTKTRGKGTGLGLSVCYGIIKSHGGSINVLSRNNKGVSFVVHLPIKGKT